MSTTSRSEVYGVRLTEDELAEFHALAETKGVKLSDAFREGARQYLSDEGQVRAATSSLQEAIDRARMVIDAAERNLQ